MGSDTSEPRFQEELPTDRVFTQVRPRLLQVARSRGCSPEDAEDVVQDAILICLKRWSSLRSHADAVIERFLVLTTVHIADRLRRQNSHISTEDLPEQEDSGDDPCETVLRQEQGRICAERLHTLTERTIQIVTARHAGMSWEEVAERNGITPANARLIYHRGLKLLRERVEPMLSEVRDVA